MPSQDYIELLIVGHDGIRRKFVGYGELIEVDNIEPMRLPMMVKTHDAPIIDLMTGQTAARLHLGDTLEVYAHVRRLHAGASHKLIALGQWQGCYVPASTLERVLPDTQPSTPIEGQSADV
ncbi:MAG: hypothetical protein F9K46_11510 [Anaerolineae bacterium]|nr:MAG: hypothetical protein F9K46_11510 [Anaerolineae bacterium]